MDDARETPISVIAWGTSAAGVGAHFTLSIDGKRVGEATAHSMSDGMTGNMITRNIVYATAPGRLYFTVQQGGAPLISTNDYVDLTATRRMAAAPRADANPIDIAPELIALPDGDFYLSLSAEHKAAGISDLPICTARVVQCSERSAINGALQ